MSISKGNELLQELYERLRGLWYKQGLYRNMPCPQPEVKEMLEKILEEYNESE